MGKNLTDEYRKRCQMKQKQISTTLPFSHLIGLGAAKIVDFLRFLDADDFGDSIDGLSLIGADVDTHEAVEDGVGEERRVNPLLQLKTRQPDTPQFFFRRDHLQGDNELV